MAPSRALYVRFGDDVASKIDGMGRERSAVIRALTLIGMHHAGMDMQPHKRHIQAALVSDLAPGVHNALGRVVQDIDGGTRTPQPRPAPRPPQPRPANDPLLDEGIEG